MHEWYRFELVIKKNRLPGTNKVWAKKKYTGIAAIYQQLKCIQI